MPYPATFSLKEDFLPATLAEWMALVEGDLKGAPFEKKLVTHTYEGIDVQPLYVRGDVPQGKNYNGFPGVRPYVRGSRWKSSPKQGADIRQEFSHPNREETNRQVLADLAGGVGSVQIHFESTGASTSKSVGDPPRAAGVDIASLADLAVVLRDVSLDKVPVALCADADFLPAAALLVSLWQQQGIDLDRAQGAFNADPLAVLAQTGKLPCSLDTALELVGDLARWTAENCPQVTALSVNTAPYHDAGATAVQDLAILLATGVTYLRSLTDGGLSLDVAARQLLFRMELGTQHFLAVAKLRAARRLWSRLIEASGGSPVAARMTLQVRTSPRVLTRRDPYVNILRNTSAMFAGVLGGAEVLTSVPFDSLLRSPTDSSRRIARNTPLILQAEAQLQRVMDPAGGSWFLDSITRQLAEEAWKFFQQIETQGGMPSVLQSGWLADQVQAVHLRRSQDFAQRKKGILGVSEFPNCDEQRLDPAPSPQTVTSPGQEFPSKIGSLGPSLNGDSVTHSLLTAAGRGVTRMELAEMAGYYLDSVEIRPFAVHRFSQPYEELCEAVDAWAAAHGNPPVVFLANMGTVAEHTARGAFAKNFFEAGGFQVHTNAGFMTSEEAATAFSQSGAETVVICSTDKRYQELVPELAPKLRQAGARTVVLAGNPGANEATWRDAGVNRFIYLKCDALEILREILREEGVIES